MTEATATAAVSAFEGLSGAFALTLIAFTIVFLVLGGLTGVIYAMRLVTGVAKKQSTVSVSVPAAGVSSNVASAAPSDEELIAVITAALIAEMGEGITIKSFSPSNSTGPMKGLIGEGVDGWIACGRVEGLQGIVRSKW